MDKFLGKASSFISGLGGNITLRCVARANVRNVVMRLHVYMYCGVCWWSWVIVGLHAVSGWGNSVRLVFVKTHCSVLWLSFFVLVYL